MPIPVDRNSLYEKLDKDKAELKREMNDIALLILKKLELKEVNKPIIKKQ